MLNRREFGRLAMAGMSAGLFSRWGVALGAQQDDAFPQGRLNADAAMRVVPDQFMSVAQIRSWFEELDSMGLRATGSQANERFIDTLQDRMSRLGLQNVHADPVGFDRWTPLSWSLDVIEGQGAGSIPVASYFPYSGSTGPEGVTGPLVYVPGEGGGNIERGRRRGGQGQMPGQGSLSGQVVLTEIDLPQARLAGLLHIANSTYDPQNELNPDRNFGRVRPQMPLRKIMEMQNAGAAAMIVILPFDDAAAKGYYAPYTGFIFHCPALYVSRSVGARLRDMASAGVQVRLKLDAAVDKGTSRNLIGIIPGASDELVILNSHTDGTNGTEDNGPNLILGMAQYLTRLPREQLPRSIMVLLTTGHFTGGCGARTFVQQHCGDIIPQTAAALTIEHVAAKDLSIAPDGSLQETGMMEPGIVFMPPDAGGLQQQVMTGLAAGEIGGTVLAGPSNPAPRDPRKDHAWSGEGQHLWNPGGVADANYITGPSYLFSAGFNCSAHTDFDRLRKAAIGFTEAALNMTRAPRQSLAVPRPPDFVG